MSWCLWRDRSLVPVLLTAYAVARELGQGRSTALIVATAIAVLPSQVSQMATAYVDNAVLAMVLAASLFLAHSLAARYRPNGLDRPRPVWPASFLVGASCGLGLLVKMSFLPLLVPAAIILALAFVASGSPQRASGLCHGSHGGAPNLVFNWVMRGSPFYPFEIVRFLPYNEQHSWILSKYGEGATVPELARAAKALVFNLFSLDPFLNLGSSGVVLVVLGCVGSIRLARSRGAVVPALGRRWGGPDDCEFLQPAQQFHGGLVDSDDGTVSGSQPGRAHGCQLSGATGTSAPSACAGSGDRVLRLRSTGLARGAESSRRSRWRHLWVWWSFWV